MSRRDLGERVIYDSSITLNKPSTKPFIKKQYIKDDSSVYTKFLTIIFLPLAAGAIGPLASLCGAQSSTIKTINQGIKYINPFMPYNPNQTFKQSIISASITTAVSMLTTLGLHSVKDLYTKSQQSTQKLLNVEIDGHKTQIIAKGTVPLSVYLGDISLIGGVVGFFAAQSNLTKACSIFGGILGNLICKAFADDSNDSVQPSAYQAPTQGSNNNNVNSNNVNSNNVNSNNSNSNNVNSNNVNINLGNNTNVNHSSNINNTRSDNDDVKLALALLGLGMMAGYALISDSTPGNYVYKFYNKSGQELPIKMEWENNSDYHLYDQFEQEIDVLC